MPGNEFPVFDTIHGRVGLAMCSEVYVPEVLVDVRTSSYPFPMNTIPEIEAAQQSPSPDLNAIAVAIREVGEAFRMLKLDAVIALEHQTYKSDLRPELLRYIVGHATLYEHSSAEQIEQFIHEGDRYLATVALAAWGIAL